LFVSINKIRVFFLELATFLLGIHPCAVTHCRHLLQFIGYGGIVDGTLGSVIQYIAALTVAASQLAALVEAVGEALKFVGRRGVASR
jgi:hypothetical protein